MNYLRKIKPTTGWLMLASLVVFACSSEDPEPVNEEELITTVILSFVNNGATDEVVTASFRDFDGIGGEVPIVDDIVLNANASYTLNLAFLNEATSPTEVITDEIRTEALDHQVFYIVSATANLTHAYGDQDSQGNPIGITGTVTTGAASNGTLTIVLIHEPNKSATGVADGRIGSASGEEDVRVQFNVRIQ